MALSDRRARPHSGMGEDMSDQEIAASAGRWLALTPKERLLWAAGRLGNG